MYYLRTITQTIRQALQDTPAIYLNGPRQAGKSTLMEHIGQTLNAQYYTLDDISVLSAALSDPQAFLSNLTGPVILDEIQLAPELFRALKIKIDDLRKVAGTKANGSFLLTGSANVLALPDLSDALVGRMQVFTLYPLSAGETLGLAEGFVSCLFDRTYHPPAMTFDDATLNSVFFNATYPQLVNESITNTSKWFESYITTLLQRDVRALAEIEKISLLPIMLKIIASRAGGLVNDASLARDVGVNAMTYRRYRSLLEAVFLLLVIPPWYRNIGKRFVKAPKLFMTDTHLLCYLLGVQATDIQQFDENLRGKIIENFVAVELSKQLSVLSLGTLYHFRTQDDKEIDFIIEKRDGSLLAIEVKAKKSIKSTDFDTIKLLKESTGKDFTKGVILYLGHQSICFGPDLYALPLQSLWTLGAKNLVDL